jgi:CheY-like chemotaxis protein
VAEQRLLNILLVDDDLDARDLLLLAFERIGVASRVSCVNSGNEAVAYLRGEGAFSDREQFAYPSLLITDLKMADGDGFRLLEQLRTTPRHRVVPTIVMSASSDADDIRKSYMLGATSYFVKPTGFEALERLLRLLYELGERIPHDSEPSDDVAAADEEYAHVPCAMPARRQRA